MRSPCCLCVYIFPLTNFWMSEPVFMKLGMCITTPELISTAYFINPFHQSVWLYVYPLIVATQRLSKNVTVAMNTHATIEELVDASFSMRSVSYQVNKEISSSQNLLLINALKNETPLKSQHSFWLPMYIFNMKCTMLLLHTFGGII
jgi:hypothetical protein